MYRYSISHVERLMCQRFQNSLTLRERYGMLKFRQLIAKAARTADGHVGITGEVAIELYRVPHDGQQHRSAAELHGVRIHRVYENGDVIRDNDLFEKAEQKYLHARFEVCKGDVPVLTKLRRNSPRFHYRSGDELRKTRYKAQAL